MIRTRFGGRANSAVSAVVAVAAAACTSVGAPGPALAQAPVGSAAGSGNSAAPRTTDPAIEAAAWLAGCWQAESPDGLNASREHWMAPRGGLMVGMSRSIRGGEVRGYELLTIRVEDDRLIYHAAPSGQAPTDFPARRVEDGHLEFVNADHDFPQKIVYVRRSEDAVETAVFGEADGAEPAFVIPYERVRCPGS